MARKKYYQTRKDRRDESRGMKRYEREDADMIMSDHSAHANMPREVMMKDYPKMDYINYEDYPDTTRDVDRQTDEMVRKARSMREQH